MPDAFYSSPAWHRLRQKTLTQWRASGRPCAFCHQPLDWSVKHGVVVDHILNRRQHPDKAHDPANLQVVHGGSLACNTKKAAYVENNKRVAIGIDGFPDGWA